MPPIPPVAPPTLYPPQYVAIEPGQVGPPGTLRMTYYSTRSSRDALLGVANNPANGNAFYPGDYTWHPPVTRVPASYYGMADLGYGPGGSDMLPLNSVHSAAALMALPHEVTDGRTFDFTTSRSPATGVGTVRMRAGRFEWSTRVPRNPTYGAPQVLREHTLRVQQPLPVATELQVGQLVYEADLMRMSPDSIIGAVLIATNSGYSLAYDWACGVRNRVLPRAGGGVSIRSGEHHGDVGIDSEDPAAWPFEYAYTGTTLGSTDLYLVYRVPPQGNGMPVTRPLAGPFCPLCNRSEDFVVRGGQHRTAPNGRAWCNGHSVATALKSMLSTTKCPRCADVCWSSEVKTHANSSGSVTACGTCRALIARLHDQGAEPHELRFGLELETEGISWTAEAKEVATKHATNWEAKSDGSLRGPKDKRGNWRNAEVISPPLAFNDANIHIVQNLARKLRNAGSRHGERCGLHVHVGMEMLSVQHVKDVVNWWYSMQATVLQALPPWHSRSSFCVPTGEDQIRHVRSAEYSTKDMLAATERNRRYSALNLSSLIKHGTVEFRFFNGSVHAGKVRAYVEFCTRLVSFASRNTHVRQGPMAGRSQPFGANRAGMIAILDNLGFEPGNTSQRWHLLGTFATEDDRPGPKPVEAPVKPLRPAVPAPTVTPGDWDNDDGYDDEEDPR